MSALLEFMKIVRFSENGLGKTTSESEISVFSISIAIVSFDV